MDKWHKYEILESDIGRVGHMFTFQNGDQKDEVRFTDVRGAWAWPIDESPFYCIILGQQWFDEELYYDKSAAFSVIFEGIDKGLDLEKRFNQLADIAELYKCDFFADLGQLHETEADSWYDFSTHKGLSYGDLEPAPWADNFRLGVELCKTSVRTHKLTLAKDTEVFNQLQRITKKDLADNTVKARYYCIEALRHVLASFRRDPASNPDINVKEHVSSGQQGWMF